MKQIDYKQLKEKKLKETINSLRMYLKTWNEMREKCDVSQEKKDEVFREIEYITKKLDFIKGLTDEQYAIYHEFPIELLHNWVGNEKFDKYIDVYTSLFKKYIDNNEKTSFIDDEEEYKEVNACGDEELCIDSYTNEKNKINIENQKHFLEKIPEPVRKNLFLVSIPERFNILSEEIVSFYYDKKSHRIYLKIREGLGRKQIVLLQNELMALSIKGTDPDETIEVSVLTPELKKDYSYFFYGIKLEDYTEDCLEYNTGKDNMRYIFLEFSYQECEIILK